MDEIDTKIMAIMDSHGPSTCYQVADYMAEVGAPYPVKRIRRRLDSLCRYDFLTSYDESERVSKGRPKKIYAVAEGDQ